MSFIQTQIPKKAAIYARVSSRQQKEEETIESQVEAIKEYAKENNYEVDERFIFLDNGVSGTTLERQALDELRDVIKFESFEVVLMYAPDRLSRNYTHQLILMEEFRKHGVGINFLKNPPIVDTPEAKMFQHFQGIFAEYERAVFLDRSRRGRIYKAKQGDPGILPSVPYGYRKAKQGDLVSVVVCEEEANIVKEIFHLYLHETCSMQEVARRISLKGIKPRKGGVKWDMATIRDMLKNPTYIGIAHFGKTKSCEGKSELLRKHGSKLFQKAKQAKRKMPSSEWIAIKVPQIISENDFEQVQEQLKKNKILSSRNTQQPALLQGLITCGICGQPFYKRRKKQGDKVLEYYNCRGQVNRRYNKCTNKYVRLQEIDKHIFEEVLNLLKTPSLIENEFKRRAKEASNTQELMQKEIITKKELTKLQHQMDRLLDAYQSGLLDLKELKKRSKEIDIYKKNLEKDIQVLQAIKMEEQNYNGFGELFEKVLEKVEKRVDELTLNEKRKLIRLLVEEIVVNRDTIEVVHCISPLVLAQQEGTLKVDAVLQPRPQRSEGLGKNKKELSPERTA